MSRAAPQHVTFIDVIRAQQNNDIARMEAEQRMKSERANTESKGANQSESFFGDDSQHNLFFNPMTERDMEILRVEIRNASTKLNKAKVVCSWFQCEIFLPLEIPAPSTLLDLRPPPD